MKGRDWLWPRLDGRAWIESIAAAGVGALVAGSYGVVHDQITYTLSEEYYTRFKFLQFVQLDPGNRPRWFATKIGLAASWWVGLITGWVIARLARRITPRPEARRAIAWGFAIAFGTAALGAIAGWAWSSLRPVPPDGPWREFAELRGVRDFAAFRGVGCIHNGSYLGGAVGMVLAALRVRRWPGIKESASRSRRSGR